MTGLVHATLEIESALLSLSYSPNILIFFEP